MTTNEAITILEEVSLIDDSLYQYNEKYLEALEMAIQSLSAEKTAEWIYDGSLGYHGESHYKCSVCGKRVKEKEVNGKLVGGYGPEAKGSEWICDYEPDFTNYCSNCGAKMKELGECNE